MKFNRPITSRRVVKYHLIRWHYYDSNVNDLEPVELNNMKMLYSALKELDPEERDLLAAKYRVEKRPSLSDEVVASLLGMTKKDFVKQRVKIEEKLRPLFTKAIDIVEYNMKSTTENIDTIARIKNISYESAVNEIIRLYAPMHAEKLKK